MKHILLAGIFGLLLTGTHAIGLDASIEMAKQNNRQLLIAREEVEKAKQTYYDVRGNLLPQFTLQGGYELSRTNLPPSALPAPVDFSSGLSATASDDDHYLGAILDNVVNSMIPADPMDEASVALQLKMTQVLFLGGKLINGIKAVDRYRSIQRLNYGLEEQKLVLNTTELFYQCLLAGKLATVQEEGLVIANRHLSRVESFYAEGLVSEFDLLRARLEIAKLQPQVLQAQNNYQLALAAFRRHLGSEDPELKPDGEFILPPEWEISLEEALAAGKKDRVELELADIASQVAQIKYNAEKGNYLPNVALQADYSLYTAADDFGIERDDFGSRYSIGIGIQIPLFTGFSNTSKRKHAKSSYYQAVLQQKDYEDLIALEIKQDWQNWHHAKENYRVQSENIKMAERSLELAQVRYDNQVGIQLEVFDAQITLSGIRLQYLQAVYEVTIKQLKLTKSIGIKI